MILCLFEQVMIDGGEQFKDAKFKFFFAEKATFKMREYVPTPEFSSLIEKELAKLEGNEFLFPQDPESAQMFQNPFSKSNVLEDEDMDN